MDYPRIDYLAHPGFAPVRGSASPSVRAQIDALDARLDPIRGGRQDPPRGWARRRLQIEIDGILQSILTIACDGGGDGPLPAASLAVGLKLARPEFLAQAEHANAANGRQGAPRKPDDGAPGARVAAALDRAGGVQVEVPAALQAEIDELLAPLRKRALALRDRNPRGRAIVGIPKTGRLWQCIKAVYAQGGLLEGLGAYAGHRVEPYNCALEYSSAEQNWWHDGHRNAGLPTNRSVGFHIDHDFDRLKSIHYVCERVDATNGAFQFVEGSHRWRRSVSETLLVKGMDRGHAAIWAGDTEYYRAHFTNPEFRRFWVRLPEELRQTTHFGDDILDGSALDAMLRDQARVCTSDRGKLIVFDGKAVLHRGGLVTEGERWALQTVFQPIEPLAARYLRLIRGKLQSRTLRLRLPR